MNLRFRPYPPQAVTVGGEIRRRMDLTAGKILHHLDVEEVFVRHFQRRKENPDLPGAFSGYGMFLDAVVKAAVHGIGGEEMVRFKTDCLAQLTATQSDDGAITAFSGKPGFWDNHDQAYMIQAFVLDHRCFGTGNSLEAALRLGNFLVGRKTLPTIGLETAFLMLFQESGDRKFLDYCRQELRLTESLDVYDRMLPINGIAHVYTWIARVLSQVQYALLTGDSSPALFAGVRELWNRVFRRFSSISGSCSGGINWGEVWDDSQTGLGRWGETCVSAYLLRCAAKMFELDADPKFGDLYERILYNAFFGAQSEDGMRQRYFIPFNEPGQWYEHETYCCPNNLRRMMFELPDAVYFETGDGVAVNLYTDSVLTLPGTRIEQTTLYPESEKVHLKISASADFTLTLRIPTWCPGARISDTRREFNASSGWFSLPVEAGEHEMEINLPMPVCLIRGTAAQTNRAALMRGPLVYAVESDRNQLSNYSMDLLTIDNTQPSAAEAEGIRVPCVLPNQTHPRMDVLFTRFSREHRTRTYFPTVSTGGLRNDPLYYTTERRSV